MLQVQRPKIEYGYCYCGCGQKTSIAKKTRTQRNIIKGRPNFYLPGHDTRKRPPIWEAQDRGYATECRVWLGTMIRGGYGWFNNKRAHVLFWEIDNGPVPNGYELHHKCNVKLCVNPDHLAPLTKGEYNTIHRAKVTPEMAQLILASPLSQRTLAAQLGLGKTTVARVRQGKSWLSQKGKVAGYDCAKT